MGRFIKQPDQKSNDEIVSPPEKFIYRPYGRKIERVSTTVFDTRLGSASRLRRGKPPGEIYDLRVAAPPAVTIYLGGSGGSTTCPFSAPDDTAPMELMNLTVRVYYKYSAPNGAAKHSIQLRRWRIYSRATNTGRPPPRGPFLAAFGLSFIIINRFYRFSSIKRL
jgi:hypothetical protein